MATLESLIMQTTDPEKLREMAKKKAIEANKKFMEMIKQTMEYIDGLDPQDRLSYASAIEDIVNGLAGSIKGWQRWCSLKQMNNIGEDEMKEYYSKMKKLVLEWLKLDLQATETQTKKLERKVKTNDVENGKSKRVKKDKKRSSIYVA